MMTLSHESSDWANLSLSKPRYSKCQKGFWSNRQYLPISLAFL